MKQLAKLLCKNKRQLQALLSNPSDVTIDHIEMPDQLEEIFGSQDYEQKLSDLYDMLVGQGMDSNLIGTVFEKLSLNEDRQVDEDSVWFETQFTQFDNKSDDKRGSMSSERRSGVKKVDDISLKCASNCRLVASHPVWNQIGQEEGVEWREVEPDSLIEHLQYLEQDS